MSPITKRPRLTVPHPRRARAAADDPPIAAVEIAPLQRVYPHVDGIKEWQTNQSVRLLWDRVFALTEQLTAADATIRRLVDEANDNRERVTAVNRAAKEALATAQLTEAERAAVTPPDAGEATIPDYYDTVVAVLATFDPVIPIADREAGKAQLTRAVAWEIYNTVGDTNIGLLAKDYGTEVNGRSTDIIVQMTDGSYADCCSDPETPGDPTTVTITASWNRHAGDSNTTDESRWIVPTAAIAAESGPMGPA